MTTRFAFLHIGKTGGSALREAISRFESSYGNSHIDIYGHRANIREIFRDDPERPVFFVVRDPVSRFISGFNSRQRLGKWGTNQWTDTETELFNTFDTPNALAEALSSFDELLKSKAKRAMKGSVHLKFGLKKCLLSVDYLESVKEKIAFIGHQPTLTNDFAAFRSIIGVPRDVELPTEDHVMAHKAPSTQQRTLSALGEKNIREHYSKDFPIYNWCLAHRQDILDRFR